MQYQQGNINAEYVSDQAQYQQPQQPQGGYQYMPVQGQPVMGQPVQQQYQYYPQAQVQYSQQQYAQYPQRVQYQNGYQQQMVIVPQSAFVVAVQPINPIVVKEMALRSYTRYFYGCNCCIGVLAMIFLIVRCVAAFEQGGAERAGGVMYIISNFFFVIGAICGIYSISRYVEKILLHYQILLVIALVFELIGSIIIFASYDQTKEDDDYQDEYSKNDKENKRSVELIFFIISLIIILICYGMFIRYARQIRSMMIDLNNTRVNQMNQNAQQGPVQNQGAVYGGAVQI
ncbi:unnamed protein product [Paramecium sonneborni]|uniref:Uncharacterized protein n=1 Tax=Paramecium sonneborni TaxID=65129 RepID=A0A8S1NHJ6_9CILI|nr:unnamed protein product [Paramecium sonneborni]